MEEGLRLALGFRLQFITAGNPQQQGLEDGDITSIVKFRKRVKVSMFVVIRLSTLIQSTTQIPLIDCLFPNNSCR